ncbi:MAG: sigma-54-dependent Fis family transcriptional regulator [Opitutaceae bacterium]|nr:sigma-54-dependent Fis family transcriptional regulator [Opitutaceae bacterium]
MTTTTILLVEDDARIAGELQRVLEAEGWTVTRAASAEAGLAKVAEEKCDLVLTDVRLPGASGTELLKRLHAERPRLPVILMTAHGTAETAIEATKLGAYDYLLKPFEIPDLLAAAKKALTNSRLMFAPVMLGGASAAREAMVGRSRAMQEIYKEIGRVAAKPVTVLIRGETGTGKELVARAIYQHSDRADRPFIAVNCAAIPETLLESELFGHERGSFTGAEARRIGRFEQANGGTIFLDEIGDLSANTQAKLLRVLQEKSLQRLGGRETIPIDARVLAATHHDLDRAIHEQQFRPDLFYRLSGVVIALPPLRERRDDIPALVQYFLRRHGKDLGAKHPSIHPKALDLLREHSWPGNIRELENVVRHALLQARGYCVAVADIRKALGGAPHRSPGISPIARHVADLLAAASRGERENVRASLQEDADRELFAQAITLAGGNQAKAARWLGVSRITMREKLSHFGVRPREVPPSSPARRP